MSEVTFSKGFLATLDKKPIKLPADHISDPRQLPNASPFILPKNPHPFSRRQPVEDAKQKKTVSVTLKPMRSGETVTIPDINLDTSIHDIKSQYAQRTALPQDKVKLLYQKKPAADLKTLKDLGVDGDVEFSVMVMGGGAATPSQTPAVEKSDPAASVPSPAPPAATDKMDIDSQATGSGSEKAQVEAQSAPPAAKASFKGASGSAAVHTLEFWSDLKDFLAQRLGDSEEAERLMVLFKQAWINQ